MIMRSLFVNLNCAILQYCETGLTLISRQKQISGHFRYNNIEMKKGRGRKCVLIWAGVEFVWVIQMFHHPHKLSFTNLDRERIRDSRHTV